VCFPKYIRDARDCLVREALEVFGFIWWLVNYGLSRLTSSTLHSVKTYFLVQPYKFITCLIRGGTTGKSCEGLVGPIPMGATSRLSLVMCLIRDGTTESLVRD
jgi:hypothetical protein